MQGNTISGVRGRTGEDAVCDYLKEKGYQIAARNYRIRGGEIDIVSIKGEYLVFTEVKTRKFGALENGSGAMTKEKMKRIIKASERFAASDKKYGEYYRRFDTAYVTVTSEDMPRVLEIEYIKGDFTAADCR